jgi:hypothetical protein
MVVLQYLELKDINGWAWALPISVLLDLKHEMSKKDEANVPNDQWMMMKDGAWGKAT